MFPETLRTWLAGPGAVKVVAAIRARALRGASTDRGELRCDLDADERRQVGRLLGTSWALSGKPVRLERLAEALSPYGVTPRNLAEPDGRPIVPHKQRRTEAADRRAAELAEVRARLSALGVADDPADAWLSDPGLPRSGDGDLLRLTEKLTPVWRALPESPAEPVRLGHLAASVHDNAHALDFDEPLGRAVARLAALVHGLDRPLRPGNAWRAAWRSIGVLCDEVSSRVLVLNLPLRGEAPAVAQTAAVPGEPVWLSLRSLSGTWTAAPGPVFVCENPTIVEAAADRLGARCPPLICTDGVAKGAATDLVAGLAAAGCDLHVRADFDRAGVTIVDQLRRAVPDARLWRYNISTYRSLLPASVARAAGGDLRDVVTAHAVHEEALLPDLLADLEKIAERDVID